MIHFHIFPCDLTMVCWRSLIVSSCRTGDGLLLDIPIYHTTNFRSDSNSMFLPCLMCRPGFVWRLRGDQFHTNGEWGVFLHQNLLSNEQCQAVPTKDSHKFYPFSCFAPSCDCLFQNDPKCCGEPFQVRALLSEILRDPFLGFFGILTQHLPQRLIKKNVYSLLWTIPSRVNVCYFLDAPIEVAHGFSVRSLNSFVWSVDLLTCAIDIPPARLQTTRKRNTCLSVLFNIFVGVCALSLEGTFSFMSSWITTPNAMTTTCKTVYLDPLRKS